MAKQANTPANISDKEITATSAEALREMTRAFPDDTNVQPPRCYGQCVESPADSTDGADDDDDQVMGQGPAYGS